jgi:hypothetical protein
LQIDYLLAGGLHPLVTELDSAVTSTTKLLPAVSAERR